MRPRLVIATRNLGKAREFAVLLAGLAVDLETLADHPEAGDVEETGSTYLENAAMKALATARECGLPALADDSGLEVDALGGRPGIHSARYSGGGDRDNVDRLLRELTDVEPERRTARFRCVLVAAHPDGRTLAVEGTCEGRIAGRPAGDGGFGFDPVFVDLGSGRTFAELPAAEKDRLSHRGRAIAALRPRLEEFLRSPAKV